MTGLPMAGMPGETFMQRWRRLENMARLFQAVADDAIAENHRAYERAQSAIQRAEAAQHEADLAYAAWRRSVGGEDSAA